MRNEDQLQDLITQYQEAHEELARLTPNAPSPSDASPEAREVREAIDRQRVAIREVADRMGQATRPPA